MHWNSFRGGIVSIEIYTYSRNRWVFYLLLIAIASKPIGFYRFMFSTCKIHKSWLLTRRTHSAHIATTSTTMVCSTMKKCNWVYNEWRHCINVSLYIIHRHCHNSDIRKRRIINYNAWRKRRLKKQWTKKAAFEYTQNVGASDRQNAGRERRRKQQL